MTGYVAFDTESLTPSRSSYKENVVLNNEPHGVIFSIATIPSMHRSPINSVTAFSTIPSAARMESFSLLSHILLETYDCLSYIIS